MLLGLLALLFSRGLSVFWPKEVLLVSYVEEDGEPREIAAQLEGRYRLAMKQLNAPMGGGSEAVDLEIKLFTGNRELGGASFLYLDSSQIQKMKSGSEIWVGDRWESGKVFFIPQSLRLHNQAVVEMGNPEFHSLLTSELEEIRMRRNQIRKLEKYEIGQINRRLDRLNRRERSLYRRAGSEQTPDSRKLEQIQEARDRLEETYAVLEVERQALRKLQRDSRLYFQYVDGSRAELPLQDFYRFYRPNQTGALGKLKIYFTSLWQFLSESPRESNTSGGIFPAIFGTFVMTVLMSAAVVPFGVLAAVYLREYANQGPLVRLVRISVLNLAGVPSIVFGVFGLGFFVYFLGGGIDALFFSDQLPTATFGTGGIFWASLTLAIMTVPVVIVATEEALGAVPPGLREASLACGASKWQTTSRVVLPASIPGILTGLILAMARGAGEVAPLMLVGVVKLAPSLPIDGQPPFIHLDRKFMHLGFHIYDLGFQSPNAEAALPLLYATAVFLILLILTLNLGAILLRNHLRKKYVSGTF
jgi:phosphate transport system permease protein